MWDLSLHDWQGFLSTDAATYSRALHFARRAAPVAPRRESASDDWHNELAAAYSWAFNTRPRLSYTTRAGLQRDTIRTGPHRHRTVVDAVSVFSVAPDR
ncbi:hypothetical protein A6A06_14360 [Streptomyces sp. CB02923]|nr:hypothetical protein A6A06_14360 [Streptomyces sp. CB02923]